MNAFFRKANAGELRGAAAIIHAVSDGVTDALAGGLPINPAEALSLAFMMKMGCFSLENITVAELDGKMAGMLFAYPGAQHHLPAAAVPYLNRRSRERLASFFSAVDLSALHVNTLWVDEEFRSCGIGRALLRKAREIARSRGLDRLGLFVWPENDRALAFYRKNGFRVSREIPPTDPPMSGRDGPHRAGGLLLVDGEAPGR